MAQTAFVFGAGGQLGTELAATFSARGWRVVAHDRSSLDITNPDAVQSAIRDGQPQLVLNAAAYNQVDLAESDPAGAYQANGLAVRHLALACREGNAKLVHYSTDYVFDGRKGSAYVESDEPHPVSSYGVSKLAGELYARAYCEDALILRTAAVFGPAGRRTARGNFVELMLRLAAKGKVRVVADQGTSPTYAPALAEMTADLVERAASGIFHAGGPEALTWFDYAQRIFHAAGLSPDLEPTTAAEFRAAAQRPIYSPLRNARAEALGVAALPSLADSLTQYFARRGD